MPEMAGNHLSNLKCLQGVGQWLCMRVHTRFNVAGGGMKGQFWKSAGAQKGEPAIFGYLYCLV